SCDGYLLKRVRALVGPSLPIVVSLDLHGSIARAMWENADALVGYRTCPHVDTYDTGLRAGRILVGAIRSEMRPVMAGVKLPMVVQAENMTSDRGEFREMLDFATSLERKRSVISASIFAVQPWLDVEELGWAAVVITDNDEAGASELATDLAQFMWSRREA